MKPFVLEEALAGARVMNGKQEPVTDIAYFPSIRDVYKVGAAINENVQYFTVAGWLFKGCPNPLMDLFMAPVMKEGWINIYKDEKPGECIYKTEAEARAKAWPGPIDCIRIEWEE
jgi:hypothetical protein